MPLSVEERAGTVNENAKKSAIASSFCPPADRTSARPYIPYLIFTICAAIYLLPFMRIMLGGTDEGTLVYGAVRIIHGQVFARDFFEVVGPGTFYWLAFFFKLFGITFFATRVCLFLTSLGTALLMYLLSRRICPRYQALPCILLLGTYFGALWPTISHHADSNFFGLLSVACMIFWYDARKNALLFAAGVFAGITTCILQPKGILLLLAFIGWLWILQRRRSTSLTSVGLVLAGYFSIAILVVAYFRSHGALADLVYVNFLWPSRHYSAVNVVSYANGLLAYYWKFWAISTPMKGVAAVLIIPFVFVAALPVLVSILGFRNRTDNARPEILLYWIAGWALWLSEIHRKDIFHLVFGSPLLVILCIYLLERYRSKTAALALQLFALSAGVLAIFNLFICLAARPVPTRVGMVGMFKPDSVLEFLDGHTRPGEEIFAYPYCPMYYFLSATTNPTRYSILPYNYSTPAQFHDAIHVLDRHRVKYIVWDTNFEEKVVGNLFPGVPRTRRQDFILEPYLESHYNVVQDFNGIRIMERKEDYASR